MNTRKKEYEIIKIYVPEWHFQNSLWQTIRKMRIIFFSDFAHTHTALILWNVWLDEQRVLPFVNIFVNCRARTDTYRVWQLGILWINQLTYITFTHPRHCRMMYISINCRIWFIQRRAYRSYSTYIIVDHITAIPSYYAADASPLDKSILLHHLLCFHPLTFAYANISHG